MNKSKLVISVVLLLVVSAFATTKWRDVNIVNSTLDKTSSWGRFTSARKSGGCTTGSSSYDTCTDVLTFDAAFADTTNLTVVCTGKDPSNGRATLDVSAFTASTVTAMTHTMGSVSVSYGAIHCVAYHP